MSSVTDILTAVSSTVVRICSYVFLRWIPGHHFPPLILGSLAVYLSCIFASWDRPHSQRPSSTAEFATPDQATPGDGATEDASLVVGHSDRASTYDDNNQDYAAPKVILSGIPNPTEKEWSYLSVGLNVLLGLCTLDMIFRGPFLHPSNGLRFSRVGYVDSTSAKVLFREPDRNQLPIYVYYQREDQSTWTIADKVYDLDANSDFTYPITFSGLSPSATYTYSLSNNLSGIFTTSPPPPDERKLSFVTSSCIKANFPYNPLSHPLTIPGFAQLSRVLAHLPSPAAFMLFLGDFIYVDVPLRLSSSMPHYRSEHRRVYASPSWALPGLAHLPWLHTLDDHEIANDWSAGNATPPFPAARDPFWHYHVSVNPPTPPSSPLGPNTTYFTFTRGPASFFMLDTRAYRTAPEPNPNATMLGQAQLVSLLRYLSTPEPDHVHWKLIASSVPFTKNWRFGTPDTWGGFLTERATILAAMHAAEAQLGVRVVVLSGDRHEFGAIRFPSHPSLSPTSGPHEFCVSPLSMFYLPFRTFQQIDDEDVAIKYLPDGNSKVGAVEITNLEGVGQQRSLMKYSLYVEGKVAWEYTLTSPGPEFQGYRAGIRDSLWG